MNTFHLLAHLADQSPLIRLIQTENDEPAVSARDLHKFLEIVERFSKWIDRMFDYGFERGVDYTPYQKVHPLNKQTFQDYALTLDTAKEVAMLQRSDKGKQARRYFIACEKALQKALHHIPQSNLVKMVKSLTVEVTELTSRLSRLTERYGPAYEAKVKADAERDIETRIKREKILTYATTIIHRSISATWGTFWDKFEEAYNLDIRGLEQLPGELTLDTAIRHGYMDQLWQYINIH